MAAMTSSLHEPASAAGSDTQNPAVLNVRRPGTLRAEAEPAVAAPHTGIPGSETTAPVHTVLRLPDLAAAVKRMPRPQFNIVQIAQWVGIALGALLALWLIFGGRGPSSATESDAPPWAPPAAAPRATPPTTGAGTAPQWQLPTPAPETEPAAHDQQTVPSGSSQPSAAPDWNDPNWNNTAGGGAQRPPVRTAQRPAPTTNTGAPAPQSPQAERLNVTVPVPQ